MWSSARQVISAFVWQWSTWGMELCDLVCFGNTTMTVFLYTYVSIIYHNISIRCSYRWVNVNTMNGDFPYTWSHEPKCRCLHIRTVRSTNLVLHSTPLTKIDSQSYHVCRTWLHWRTWNMLSVHAFPHQDAMPRGHTAYNSYASTWLCVWEFGMCDIHAQGQG